MGQNRETLRALLCFPAPAPSLNGLRRGEGIIGRIEAPESTAAGVFSMSSSAFLSGGFREPWLKYVSTLQNSTAITVSRTTNQRSRHLSFAQSTTDDWTKLPSVRYFNVGLSDPSSPSVTHRRGGRNRPPSDFFKTTRHSIACSGYLWRWSAAPMQPGSSRAP